MRKEGTSSIHIIHLDPRTYLFLSTQTTGALNAEQVVETALEIILAKVTEIQTQLVHLTRAAP